MEDEKVIMLFHDAINQLEYLHQKFQKTGSGNAIISRLKTAVSELENENELAAQRHYERLMEDGVSKPDFEAMRKLK